MIKKDELKKKEKFKGFVELKKSIDKGVKFSNAISN